MADQLTNLLTNLSLDLSVPHTTLRILRPVRHDRALTVPSSSSSSPLPINTGTTIFSIQVPISLLQKSPFLSTVLEIDAASPIELFEEEGLVSISSVTSLVDFLSTGRFGFNQRVLDDAAVTLGDYNTEIERLREFVKLADFLGVDIPMDVAQELNNRFEALLKRVMWMGMA